MPHGIRKVAVLGAGTMGAAIAAHCANAGLKVDLLDIAADDDDKNAVVEAGFDRMKNARPAALMAENVADRIRIGNFEEHFGRVGEADWIVEAIIEKLEPKRELMQRVEDTAKEDAIISTNTSGIPLHSISEGRSEEFKRRFVGTHFFNPPRYLKLMEIIPTENTDPEIVEAVRNFGERVLGKGGVIAKDTPNFIGNRIGTFAGMQSARYAFENGYGIEEVDAITGPLIGHPKTATFRLNDQVGLDIAVGVAENLYEAVPEDESREALKPPEKLEEMKEKDLLGNKTGAGFYKRDKRDGKTVFDVLDLEAFEHHPAENSDTLEDVDHAMEWGFAHQTGPFRTWDLLGVRETVKTMESMDIDVASWVKEMLEAGNDTFYKTENGTEPQFSPGRKDYESVREDPMYVSLDRLRDEGKELARNDSASLLDLGDGVLCLEFHSKGNSIDAQIVEMGNRGIHELERDDVVGLVVGNEGRNFSVGANLGEMAHAVKNGDLDQIEESVEALQDLLMAFRFAPKPVVSAPHGQTLGGGLEVCLHSDRIVADGATYMGLVEVGVGLIPAGGGTKEMARRLISPPLHTAPDTPPLPFLQKAFEQIALAKTATSALQAKEMGFLTENDRIVMNADHLISAAKREVEDLADGYTPPEEANNVYAAGRTARAALQMGIKTMQWGHYASDYDGVIAGHVARILTGGNLSLPQWVPEEYLLKLEKKAFLDLLKQEKTHERIEALLETGKPKRN